VLSVDALVEADHVMRPQAGVLLHDVRERGVGDRRVRVRVLWEWDARVRVEK
jgi:hypothetical protein